MLRRFVVLPTVAALTGALGASTGVVSARTASGGPPGRHGCSAGTVAQLVRSLVAAFNAGSAATVDRLVAREPEFQWFSAPGTSAAASRLGKRAEDRSTLRAYIRLRHRHHERWTHVRVEGNLGLTLTREADDYARSRVRGKGEAVCTGGVARIIVWSL
jgi:hypothetical protein